MKVSILTWQVNVRTLDRVSELRPHYHIPSAEDDHDGGVAEDHDDEGQDGGE